MIAGEWQRWTVTGKAAGTWTHAHHQNGTSPNIPVPLRLSSTTWAKRGWVILASRMESPVTIWNNVPAESLRPTRTCTCLSLSLSKSPVSRHYCQQWNFITTNRLHFHFFVLFLRTSTGSIVRYHLSNPSLGSPCSNVFSARLYCLVFGRIWQYRYICKIFRAFL